ncbi:type II toxin-antitoxin system PemK/MazF family toxin [Thioclava sp. F36-7]|uniref:type II toxin-antitoxin system PemK/MazF family toxin n=1 Tax=Thioclava sp. F36-7 TaxID=1915317 RepID=UPI0009979BCF|nr:type II toxin-antitoxin system PemK/MazF family toxin [Thioclava sp. F36-7]OOY06951.1 hypothetical protein BMI89_20070 [Thioclava sp. F36-7]
MLETPSTRPAKPQQRPKPWSDTIKAGDIISYRFPLREGATEERPKPRPCLVLAVSHHNGQRWLCIAYGTSSRKRARNPLGIELSLTTAMACGLDRATGFLGSRTRVIRTNDPALCVCPDLRTPVLGALSGRAFERMLLVQKRLLAQHAAAEKSPA